ncbi:MAG: hypothetical protein EB830_05315 [Nitrosopumilus sp. H13]|nr:MAG: hypothetical protein EB830_05315 [Nitrosopumilus sp. H13]
MISKYAPMLALTVLALLIPVTAYAQTTDEFVAPPAIEPEDDTIGPVGIVDELMLAHSDPIDIMLQQNIEDFDTSDTVKNTVEALGLQ